MVAPVRPRTARTHWRKCSAPPSARSSRVTEVITTCRKPEPVARFGQAVRLIEGDLLGPPALDGAKAARPRADVAQDHERRRAAGPAFRAVRATRTLAHRLQPQLADQAAGERHPARGRDRPLEPFGQSPRRRAHLRRSDSGPARPTSCASRTGRLGRPGRSPGAGSIDMRKDLAANQRVASIDVVSFQAEYLFEIADQRLADLGHRRMPLAP